MVRGTADQRRTLMERFIGPSIPRLWCPPITHYTETGTLDIARTTAHWKTMVRHVGGFLVPGSTGEVWEMTPDEVATLLKVAIDLAVQLETRVLVGVLRTELAAMHEVIGATLDDLRTDAGEDNRLVALEKRHVAGFTVCPPSGADLTQAEIQTALESILGLGLPTALYQLPQVTQNEIGPAAFASIAARYPNLLLFKDTSGHDRVPLADRGESGVYLVRGAEGSYAEWLEEGGGCYRGLLLSSANCFANQLGAVISLLECGKVSEARSLSQRLTAVIDAAFAAVDGLSHSNAFANANKAMDHFMAHGPAATSVPPPLLHAGVRLPLDVIRRVGEVLSSGGFVPATGYLAAP